MGEYAPFYLVVPIHALRWYRFKRYYGTVSPILSTKVKLEFKPIWNLALGVARGVLIEKLKGMSLESHYLPVVDLDKFAPYAVLTKEPK